MNRIILSGVLLLIACGCSSIIDDDFFAKLKSAPSAIVPKESHPEWLVVKINEMEAINSRDVALVKIRIYKGEWRMRTVYYIYNSLSSSICCEVYYKDGKREDWSVENRDNFCAKSKNWRLIYEFGEGFSTLVMYKIG